MYFNIVNTPPGQIPPSVKAPAPHRQQNLPTQGTRERRGRDWSGGERGGGRGRGTGRQNSRNHPPKEKRIAKRQWSVERRWGRMRRKRREKDKI